MSLGLKHVIISIGLIILAVILFVIVHNIGQNHCITPDEQGIAHDPNGEYIPGNHNLFILEQQTACYKGCLFGNNNSKEFSQCLAKCKDFYGWEEQQ